MRRRHPAVLGALGALVALGAAVGAAAAVQALGDDEPARPEPEVTLTFDEDDDESGQDDLVGGDVEGQPATATFTLLDGSTASLADFAGRPVVVNFFASWCAPCIAEMPAFESVHQDFGDDVVFVGLNVRESVAKAEEMVERTGVTYLVGRDPSGELFTDFGVINMPSTFFVSADGVIADSHAGALTASELRAKIEALL